MQMRKMAGMTGMALAAILLLAAAGMAQADAITHGGTTINMDFVTVGNAGNTGEVQSQGTFGAVAYEYDIGKYEVTADQWAAVIAADSAVGNAGDWTGSQPTAGTSWNEAAKFCNWLTTGSATSGYYTITDGVASTNALSHDAYHDSATYFLLVNVSHSVARCYTGQYIMIFKIDPAFVSLPSPKKLAITYPIPVSWAFPPRTPGCPTFEKPPVIDGKRA